MTDKNTKNGALRFLIKLFQIILYIPIQIIFIPFAIVGLIVGNYKEMVVSKKLGVSYSAGQALQYRWIMHHFNTRPDPLSVAFTKKFPCESHFALWSIMGALIISQRLFGFTTRLGKLVAPGEETLDSTAGIRVLTFDKIMEKYVDEMEQIVLPGAGFDLIALAFTKGKELKVFELDQVNTLNVKVETLQKAGIPHDWITYIPVDYVNESWADKLLEAGFDKTKKTLFLWQSVSLFLEAETVKETVREMADLCVDGSIIAQDFYSTAFMSGEISKIATKNMSLIAKMGEPWRFTIDMSNDPKAAIESFLNECGLKMTEYILPKRWLGIPLDRGMMRAASFESISDTQSVSKVFDVWLAAAKGDYSGMALLSLAGPMMFANATVWGDNMAKAASADYAATQNFRATMNLDDSIFGSPRSEIAAAAAGWPVNSIPAEYQSVQPSDVETLLVSGSIDPWTPVHLAEEFLASLSNGQHVVVAESGHGEMLSRQPEASEKLLATFFKTGTGDVSGFTYQAWEYNLGLGFPAIAKIVAGIIVLLIVVLIFIVRFFLKKQFGM